MVRKLAAAALALVFFGPAMGLIGIGVLMNPAAAYCANLTGSVNLGAIPESLTVTTARGETFTLNRQQLTHAATIIAVGSGIDGVGRAGIKIALMAALTESTLRMLSNTGAYPESANYPHDGNGSDHDSLGLFQMRPQSGWGTVADLMNPTYQAQAFYGGKSGPNYPSPRGLLDIPGWQQMDPGQAAQAVEVSAFPDRYRNYGPVADTILATLTTSGAGASGAVSSSRVVFPLPAGTWVTSSPYGVRVHPITGERKLHAGTDFSAPDGTPILAVADGTVTVAGASGGYGNLIVIEHTIDGQTVATAYAHMWDRGVHVNVGERVQAGQHIGDVGSSGLSTGPHLHFEVRPGGTEAARVDPEQWLASHGAGEVAGAAGLEAASAACGEAATDATSYSGLDPDRLVDDPTSAGRITERTANVLAQLQSNFPDSRWSCWSPRPGQKSEHPLGRACDGTFGNSIGTAATGPALETGWTVTTWLKDNAQALGVQYLIWQGRIWSVARSAEGWRPYGGGGMHDPGDVTGGHYDHLHITIAGFL